MIIQNHNIPAALPAEFVQRTASNTIEIIPPPELAIDGAWFDVFWDGGSRKRILSLEGSGNPAIFTLSGGTGDDYPVEETNYMVRHSYFSQLKFSTTAILMMLLSSSEDGEFRFSNAAGNFGAASDRFSVEVRKNYLHDWQRGSGILPYHYITYAAIQMVYMTPNKNAGANAATMKIGVLLPK